MLDKQLATLWTELSKPAYAAELAAKHWQALADALNVRVSVPNPIPQPTRAKLIAWDAFMDLLEPAEVLKLYTYPGMAADLRSALEANDRIVTLAIWRGFKTQLLAATVTKVQAEAAKTELDPNWQATIQQPSIAQGLGLSTLAVEDVQTAAHRFGGA